MSLHPRVLAISLPLKAVLFTLEMLQSCGASAQKV
jgi:hypothetical protein